MFVIEVASEEALVVLEVGGMSGDEDPGIRWQDMLGMSEEEIDAEIDESSLWSIKALAVGREVSGFVQGQKEPSEMYTRLMWCHPPWW